MVCVELAGTLIGTLNPATMCAGMAPSDEQLPSYCLPFEEAAQQASVRIITRRPVAPSDEEQAANVRSRSAKLRVVEKL